MRHRETEFDVEEGAPSVWHWIIYPGGAVPEVIGQTKFRSEEAPLLPALKKSIIGLKETETRRRSVQPVNEGCPARSRLTRKTAANWSDLAAGGRY